MGGASAEAKPWVKATRKLRKATTGQNDMLMPSAGKKPAKEAPGAKKGCPNGRRRFREGAEAERRREDARRVKGSGNVAADHAVGQARLIGPIDDAAAPAETRFAARDEDIERHVLGCCRAAHAGREPCRPPVAAPRHRARRRRSKRKLQAALQRTPEHQLASIVVEDATHQSTRNQR